MTKLVHCKTGDILDLPELITLQSCHITQKSQDDVKTDWAVEENITNKLLHTLPKKLTDNEVMGVINFAKKYELEAFNIGINFQKEKQNEFLKATILELQNNNDSLAKENTRLATVLEHILPEN